MISTVEVVDVFFGDHVITDRLSFFHAFWRWNMVSGLRHRALGGLPVVFEDDKCKQLL